MLDFSMTVISEPDLILLDEPCAGLSKSETETMIAAISGLAKSTQGTFIIVEHDMHVVFSLADTISVLSQGAIIVSATPAEIRGNPIVQEAYLGGVEL